MTVVSGAQRARDPTLPCRRAALEGRLPSSTALGRVGWTQQGVQPKCQAVAPRKEPGLEVRRAGHRIPRPSLSHCV